MQLAEQIRALGYSVDEFVLRINGVLVIYLPSGKWLDLRTGERGRKPPDQMIHLIEQRMGKECNDRPIVRESS